MKLIQVKLVALAALTFSCASTAPPITDTGPASEAPIPQARPDHAVDAIWNGNTTTCIKRGRVLLCSGGNHSKEYHSSGLSSEVMRVSDIFSGDVTDVHIGGSNICVLEGGVVRCTGSSLEGKRGDGCTLNQDGIVCNGKLIDRSDYGLVSDVTPLPPIQEIEGGTDSTCALSKDGQVWCWGSNIEGELGAEGGHLYRPLRVEVPSTKRIYSGETHHCALTESDQLWCWGNYRIDEEPNPMERNVQPKQFTSLGKPASPEAVMLSSYGVCVRQPDGSARCLGSFTSEAGPPLESEDPMVFRGLKDIVTGLEHTCVLLENGEVTCVSSWPHLAGMPGAQDNFESKWRAVVLPYKSAVERLLGYRYGTCAVSVLGEVACWGAYSDAFGMPVENDEGFVDAPRLMRFDLPAD